MIRRSSSRRRADLDNWALDFPLVGIDLVDYASFATTAVPPWHVAMPR
jgi:hypothetical protein